MSFRLNSLPDNQGAGHGKALPGRRWQLRQDYDVLDSQRMGQ